MKRSIWLIAALAFLLAGCQTVSGWFGSKPAAPKFAELVAFTPITTPRVLWQVNAGKSEKNVFFPAVVGNQVYVSGNPGTVLGIEANTGRVTGSFAAGQVLSAGVGSGAGLLFLGTPRGEVLAYEPTGKLVWKSQLAGELLAPPVAEGNIVVVRVGDGRIHGLDVADGKRRWVYQRTLPTLSLRSPSGVVVNRGAVFAGFPGGRLVALSLDNGNVGWESVVALPRGATELERVADVIGLPALDANRVCAVAYQGRAACFEAGSGAAVWARDVSSATGIGSDTRNIYITDEKDAVVALDKSNGASLWKQDKMGGRRLTAPLALGRFVIVGDLQGYVHLLSREDGSFAGRIATDGSAISAMPVAVDFNTFVVQTRNGGVYALSLL